MKDLKVRSEIMSGKNLILLMFFRITLIVFLFFVGCGPTHDKDGSHDTGEKAAKLDPIVAKFAKNLNSSNTGASDQGDDGQDGQSKTGGNDDSAKKKPKKKKSKGKKKKKGNKGEPTDAKTGKPTDPRTGKPGDGKADPQDPKAPKGQDGNGAQPKPGEASQDGVGQGDVAQSGQYKIVKVGYQFHKEGDGKFLLKWKGKTYPLQFNATTGNLKNGKLKGGTTIQQEVPLRILALCQILYWAYEGEELIPVDVVFTRVNRRFNDSLNQYDFARTLLEACTAKKILGCVESIIEFVNMDGSKITGHKQIELTFQAYSAMYSLTDHWLDQRYYIFSALKVALENQKQEVFLDAQLFSLKIAEIFIQVVVDELIKAGGFRKLGFTEVEDGKLSTHGHVKEFLFNTTLYMQHITGDSIADWKNLRNRLSSLKNAFSALAEVMRQNKKTVGEVVGSSNSFASLNEYNDVIADITQMPFYTDIVTHGLYRTPAEIEDDSHGAVQADQADNVTNQDNSLNDRNNYDLSQLPSLEQLNLDEAREYISPSIWKMLLTELNIVNVALLATPFGLKALNNTNKGRIFFSRNRWRFIRDGLPAYKVGFRAKAQSYLIYSGVPLLGSLFFVSRDQYTHTSYITSDDAEDLKRVNREMEVKWGDEQGQSAVIGSDNGGVDADGGSTENDDPAKTDNQPDSTIIGEDNPGFGPVFKAAGALVE